MAIRIIPTTPGVAFSVRRVSLDGSEYVLRLRWNSREARWYMSLSDADDVLIVGGVKLVAGWPLLRLVVDARRPPGQLVALDQAGDADPNLDDLGTRVVLVYIDQAEAAELAEAL